MPKQPAWLAKLAKWLETDEGQDFSFGSTIGFVNYDEARSTILNVTGHDIGDFEEEADNDDYSDATRAYALVIAGYSSPEAFAHEIATMIAEGELAGRKALPLGLSGNALAEAILNSDEFHRITDVSRLNDSDCQKLSQGAEAIEFATELMQVGAIALSLAKSEMLDDASIANDTPADVLRGLADAFDSDPSISENFREARKAFRIKTNHKSMSETADSLSGLDGLTFEDFQRETA